MKLHQCVVKNPGWALRNEGLIIPLVLLQSVYMAGDLPGPYVIHRKGSDAYNSAAKAHPRYEFATFHPTRPTGPIKIDGADVLSVDGPGVVALTLFLACIGPVGPSDVAALFVEEADRLRVWLWVRNWLYCDHRQRNYVAERAGLTLMQREACERMTEPLRDALQRATTSADQIVVGKE